MPGVVKAAGIIWIVVGALGVLGQLLSLGGGFRPQNIAGLVISVAFLIVGIQTITGKAKDTLGNGIGSIVIGLLNGAFLVYVTSALPGALAGVALLFGAPVVLGLIAGGILALAGRARYKEWRIQRG
jgi:hypothetical protein